MIAIFLILFVRKYYLNKLVDTVETSIRTTIESLINTAIDKVVNKTNVDEIYKQIMKTINSTGITLPNGTVISGEDLKELFSLY
ncbi:hypothetical protein [Mesoplasma melaleucae]|uniref:hypothetical protein n=1 Tax=Mesoplasma melaleucae TaxID=81459 RepID=UPI000489EA76|nr:hypothetical protein [Mesoplasma melaleucae]